MREVAEWMATLLAAIGVVILVVAWTITAAYFLPILFEAASRMEGPALFMLAHAIGGVLLIVAGILGAYSEGPHEDDELEEEL